MVAVPAGIMIASRERRRSRAHPGRAHPGGAHSGRAAQDADRLDWADVAAVMGLLVYNATVGFWQDSKAASALAALKKGFALKARVLRDGA